MATYTQVYKGEIYEFTTDDELINFTQSLDKQGTSYSTKVTKNKYFVEIL